MSLKLQHSFRQCFLLCVCKNATIKYLSANIQ